METEQIRVDVLPTFMEESVQIINETTNNTLPEFISFKDNATVVEVSDTKYLEADYQITALEDVTPILQLSEEELSEFNLYFGSQSF